MLLLLLPFAQLGQSWTLLYSLPENQILKIKKNQLLTTLSQLGMEFKVSFELWVDQYFTRQVFLESHPDFH